MEVLGLMREISLALMVLTEQMVSMEMTVLLVSMAMTVLLVSMEMMEAIH